MVDSIVYCDCSEDVATCEGGNCGAPAPIESDPMAIGSDEQIVHCDYSSNILTLAERLSAVREIDDGFRASAVAKKYGITANTIREIYKKRFRLREHLRKNPSLVERRRIRGAKYERVEAALRVRLGKKNKKPSRSEMKRMAVKIARRMNCGAFMASNGWLQRFLERSKIPDRELDLGASIDEVRTSLKSFLNFAPAAEEDGADDGCDYNSDDDGGGGGGGGGGDAAVADGGGKQSEPPQSESPQQQQQQSDPKPLTHEQKLMVIQQIENGRKAKDVALEYGLPSSTIYMIYKNRTKLRANLMVNPRFLRKKRISLPRYEAIETAVKEYVQDEQRRGVKVTGNMILQKAQQVADELNCDGFKGSNGWLHKFRNRLRAEKDAPDMHSLLSVAVVEDVGNKTTVDSATASSQSGGSGEAHIESSGVKARASDKQIVAESVGNETTVDSATASSQSGGSGEAHIESSGIKERASDKQIVANGDMKDAVGKLYLGLIQRIKEIPPHWFTCLNEIGKYLDKAK